MEVVFGGSSGAIEIVVRVTTLLGHVLLKRPSAHVLAAPGNSGALEAAIAVVTTIPLIVVGAVFVQDHCAGHVDVPVSAQFPLSTTSVFTVPTVATHDIVICGLTCPAPNQVRSTRKMATQPLAAVGVCVSATVTPVC
jgi:hypothetical protein